MNTIQRFIKAIAPRRRALSMDAVIDAVWWDGPAMRLVDIFVGQNGLFALYIKGATLYRADIDVDHDAQTVSIGEPEELDLQLNDSSHSSVTILRQADGQFRIFMRACVAVLNRVGEIDSTKLFDNMIHRAEASGIYPTIDFYHLGGEFEVFDFGQIDFVARDGLVYCASGTLDPDHPLTPHFVRSVEGNPDFWGCSIEFLALRQESMEIPVSSGDNIALRVFDDGFNTRITVCPEADAASHFTHVTQQERMSMKTRALNEQQRASLLKLFNDDEDALAEFLAGNEDVNRLGEDMISRARGGDDNDADSDPDPNDAFEPGIEIDEEAVEQIARTVYEMMGGDTNQLEQIAEATETTRTAFEAITAQLAGITERLDTFGGRVAALEAEEDEYQQQRNADLPDSRRGKRRVTFRPREARGTNPDDETMEVAASRTLAKLPKY